MVDPAAWWHYAFAVVVEKLRADTCWRSRLPNIEKRRRIRCGVRYKTV